MRIGIDVREACIAQPTGKGMWTRGFLTELLRRGISVTTVADTQTSLWTVDHALVFPKGFRWHQRVAHVLRSKPSIDLFVSPTSYIVPALVGSAFPVIPVVHDLIAFRSEPNDRKAQWIERLTLKQAASHSAHIMTVSETTKNDLMNRYSSLRPDTITPIFAGPMLEEVPLADDSATSIVSIGTLCPRKNQERLIEAYCRLPMDVRDKHSLILAGARGWQDDRIVQLAESTPGITWKKYVSDDVYQQLLHSAAVFAFPSLYEGFGMSVLDALQRGIPVLTSDRGSLREVAGSSAVFVDPLDVGSITAGLDNLLRSQELRSRLRRHGSAQASQFSWKRTVDLFLQALSEKEVRSMK